MHVGGGSGDQSPAASASRTSAVSRDEWCERRVQGLAGATTTSTAELEGGVARRPKRSFQQARENLHGTSSTWTRSARAERPYRGGTMSNSGDGAMVMAGLRLAAAREIEKGGRKESSPWSTRRLSAGLGTAGAAGVVGGVAMTRGGRHGGSSAAALLNPNELHQRARHSTTTPMDTSARRRYGSRRGGGRRRRHGCSDEAGLKGNGEAERLGVCG